MSRTDNNGVVCDNCRDTHAREYQADKPDEWITITINRLGGLNGPSIDLCPSCSDDIREILRLLNLELEAE